MMHYTQTMNLSTMTFHESYGDLPRALLYLFRRFNVSPSDYTMLLAQCGWEYGDPDIDFSIIHTLVKTNVHNGQYRPHHYF